MKKNILLLLFYFIPFLSAISQYAEADTLTENSRKKTQFYITPSAGIINGIGKSNPAIGVKIGVSIERFGRIGPQLIASLPDAYSLALSVIDYEYPIKIVKRFNIIPNIGIGYTHNTSRKHSYYFSQAYIPISSIGINAGISVEFMFVKWLGIKTEFNYMLGKKDACTSFLTGSLVFIL
ncbi:MAG: hypothetical protein H8D45_25930 [Bacteroidetes bacterium]|nr:hypothetical protein [Bacteroidota bacterium]MBL7102770.1 hypothetical protein [Bacteroidales bacterium]